MTDRTVHAVTEDRRQIVRYGKAGKWYVENPPERRIPRQHVLLEKAVRIAQKPGTTVFYGRHGGSAFDAAVREGRKT